MRRASLLLLVAWALLAPACTVLEYRDIQTDFQIAAAADNEATTTPFIDPGANYDSVLAALTPEYIKGMKEARLRPNAWMLRAVSCWRTNQYEDAVAAATAGLKDPGLTAGSRDAVIMEMIPGLVREAQVMDDWAAKDKKFTAAEYEAQRDNMKKAWKALGTAESKATTATPQSVRSYLHYQRWRVAQNWVELIRTTVGASRDERNEMRKWAKDNALGEVPSTAADVERDKILPATHPLRALIAAQGG
ncbi:MAG: hypothetical protein ACYTGZ_17175 [Planctomycetota bacterium]|jgi:hypothetical protein